MYLVKVENPLLHGVDYTKGLEDGRHCGIRHPYYTTACRPMLYTEKDAMTMGKPDTWVDYDTLSDEEKLELGEPLFFGSPLHRALSNVKTRNRTVISELDVQGRIIAEEVRVREEFSYENS